VTLTAKDVLEITRLLDESTFTELDLEIDGMKLSLRRGAAPALSPRAAALPASGDAASAPMPASETTSSTTPIPVAPELATADAACDPRVHDVTAPLLGVFYRAPKPGAAPFVQVGALVEEDTVIGIIEVMKLMNAVRAGIQGSVTEILAVDGVLVEYGQTLLRVRKAS
jgi:acetyl-CoA carboxylase biotin carboxyl carrier protein